MLRLFLNDESGATAIEYGLIAVLTSIAGIAAFSDVGTAVQNIFENSNQALLNATN